LVWCAWLGYWVLLFAVMHSPKPPGAFLAVRLGDKLTHAGAYYVLGMLGGWVAIRSGRRTDRAWLVRWLLLYAAYAAADELAQFFVPGRVAQLSDWIADVVGATLALAFVYAISTRGGAASNDRDPRDTRAPRSRL
jgi:VanZ family protein